MIFSLLRHFIYKLVHIDTCGKKLFSKNRGRRHRVLRSNKLVSATALVLLLVVVALAIVSPYVAAETKKPTVVYYDLPTYSQRGQLRTVQIGISPYQNADPLGPCVLGITDPRGNNLHLEAVPNGTGYVSFNYTPDLDGNYSVDYFVFSGARTSTDNYTSFDAPIDHHWTVSREADVTPPFGTVVINNDEESTDNNSVVLTVSAEDDVSTVTWMRFSNDATSWSPWERYTVFTPEPSYVTSRDWALSSGNGSKNVYAQFMNEAGLVSDSFSDSIFLGSAKSQSSITCSVSKSALEIGENAVITGQLYPALEGASIVVRGRAEGSTWIVLGTTLTSPDGTYSFDWSPTADGRWEVMASWEGDEATAQCESQPLTLDIAEPAIIGPRELSIITMAVAAISVPAAGIAVHMWRQVLNRAQNASEKLNKKLEERNYKEAIEELDKLIELIKQALSLNKLPQEINQPPYSLLENLESIKKTLSESIAEKTIDKVLQESEISAYLSGVPCVLKTFQNSKDLKAPQRADSASEFFVAFLSATTKVFDKVNQVSKAAFKDFWFIWENDEYEPVRLFFDNGNVVRARFRWHWAHFDISNPYVDDKGRIEVFFLPQFHTPIIRRSKADVCFIVFAKCYCAMVHDYMVVLNEKIDEYYTKSGWKATHWPPINYPGW
jgi:hypothetical protein